MLSKFIRLRRQAGLAALALVAVSLVSCSAFSCSNDAEDTFPSGAVEDTIPPGAAGGSMTPGAAEPAQARQEAGATPGVADIQEVLEADSFILASSPEGIAWLDDGLNDVELKAAVSLKEIEQAAPEAARSLAGLAWVTDQISMEERVALEPLNDIAKKDAALAEEVVELPWLRDGEVTDDELETLTHIKDIAGEDVSMARQIVAFEWLTDGITRDKPGTLAILKDTVAEDATLARRVAESPWIADGVTRAEQGALAVVQDIASEDLALAQRIAESPAAEEGLTRAELQALIGSQDYQVERFQREYPAIAEVLMSFPWVADGVSEDERGILFDVWHIAKVDVPLAQQALTISWVAGGDTNSWDGSAWVRENGLIFIRDIAEEDLSLARTLVSAPWMDDGVNREEYRVLNHMRRLASADLPLAQALADFPWFSDGITGMKVDTIRALGFLADHDSAETRLLRDQSWFKDGLTDEEAALVIALMTSCRRTNVCQELTEDDRVDSKSLSFPSGGANVFVVQRTANGADATVVFEAASTGIRAIGEVMGSPWVKRDVVIYLEPELPSCINGANSGTHIVMLFSPESTSFQETLYHELAHYYIRGGPFWLIEGSAEFLASYTLHTDTAVSLQSRYDLAQQNVSSHCSPHGLNKIQDLYDAAERMRSQANMGRPSFLCPYYLGEVFLLGIYNALGHEVVSPALRLLDRRIRVERKLTNEDVIYQAFEQNVPTGRKGEFRDLYQRLHGGGIPGHTAPERAGSPETDRAALVALYNATGGENWERATNWLSEAPVGEWHGVTADLEDRVIEIDLGQGQGLVGSLPPELGDLALMEVLSLYGDFTGPIPPELGKLSRLRFLSFGVDILFPSGSSLDEFKSRLAATGLTGPIPPELGNLSELRQLYLTGHKLTGPIPAELGRLSNLERIFLEGNNLSGPIPPTLGHLSNLVHLWIEDNDLTGPLPPELAGLSRLAQLHVSFSKSPGAIPPWLGDMPSLKGLSLSCTEWDGPLPEELVKLSNLEGLEIVNAQLSGPIPSWLGRFSELSHLVLGDNNLTGRIPAELGNLQKLLTLNLSGNGLTGPIPPELGNLSNLSDLELHRNQLAGPVPRELGEIPDLVFLGLDTELHGSAPEGPRVSVGASATATYCYPSPN